MLYAVFYSLKDFWFGFNVFRYITFRAAMAAVTALILSIVLGPLVIKLLRFLDIGEHIRKKHTEKLYELHKDKKGTPTMGGVLILLSLIISTVLWADLTNRYIGLVLLSTVWLGFVGFVDDAIKLGFKSSRGLSLLAKFLGQFLLAVAVGLYLYLDPEFSTNLELPFLKDVLFELGPLFIVFAALVIIGSSNAVNLTDGLDGLAIGCTSMVALTFCILSYIAGHNFFSSYLLISFVPNGGELAVFCAAMVGAGLGFLWYNSYPAQIFMGDTGSLALGGALGIVAVLIKKELLLILAGGVFVVEAVSVIIQVLVFKATGRRFFLMAPLHHHFQLKGLSESKVIIRFWIVSVILLLLSLATLKLR